MVESELEIVKRHMGAQSVNVVAILSELGVDYEERRMFGGESGWIEYGDGRFKVVVNQGESPQRKRFTAAHELGHYLIQRDLLCEEGIMKRHTDRLFGDVVLPAQSSPITHRHEVQANKMAAQIIMPATRIKELWAALDGHSEDKIATLAEKFDVSIAAMSIRAKTLRLV